MAEGHRQRLVLADDHGDVLKELRRLLDPEFDVAAALRDGPSLLEAAGRLHPDAVICDLRMPGMSGIEAGARILSARLAKAVVVLSMYREADLIRQALDAGILGYVLKVDASEELIPAIYSALAGKPYLSRNVRALRAV